MKFSSLIFASLALAAGAAGAAEFKKVEECKPGLKVMDRQDKSGTVASISNGMCRVKLEDCTERGYLHWMLRPAGAGKLAADQLASGIYVCYSGSNYAFIDIHIDGKDSYRDKKGAKGRYRLEPSSSKIVFESGSLKEANAKLLAGPKIGLNMNGGNFYNTTCSLKK